jgi:hypothetical protein
MKLDEYKKMVEAQRAESLQNAIAALTKANNILTKTFNTNELEDK